MITQDPLNPHNIWSTLHDSQHELIAPTEDNTHWMLGPEPQKL